jgi:5-formyltetrahydrofolate cyclo-ligase
LTLETEKNRPTALGVTGALDAAKREARRVAKGLRAAAGRNSPRAGERLAARLLETFETPAGTGVSAFWPLDGEIDIRPAMTDLHERGCQVALPVMRGPGMALQFRRWQPGDELTPAAFGTREPGGDKPAVIPKVLLVPLLAFDRAGYRLGYGGGFYDRTLAELRGRGAVCAIGLAYAGQEMQDVPHDDKDQPLDWIVTEEEAIRIERG